MRKGTRYRSLAILLKGSAILLKGPAILLTNSAILLTDSAILLKGSARPSSLPLSDDDTKAKMATPDEALFPHPCVDWYRARDLLKPDDPRIRALFSPLFDAPPWEPRQSNPPCVARAPRAVSMRRVVRCFA